MADLDTRPVAPETKAPPEKPGRRRSRLWRVLFIVVAVFAVVVVYAYAFEKTDVDLDEIQSETRQTQLVRIVRALAHPELLTYETVDTNLDATFMSPCPEGGFEPPSPDTSGPYITLTPPCVEPGGQLQVSGFGLEANTAGSLIYVASSGVEINLGDFRTNEGGEFVEVVDTRERSSDEPQTIRAVTKVRVGSLFNWVQVPTGEIDAETSEEITVTSPRLSDTSLDTWDKIIETVFLALIATTVGTIIAVPLSFFAARNLMKDISVPVTSLTLSILAGIIGVGVGLVLARFTGGVADVLSDNTLFVVAGLILIPAAMYFVARWIIPPEDETVPTTGMRAARFAAALGVGVGAIITLLLAASLLQIVGGWLETRIGFLGFIATFFVSVGEVFRIVFIAGAVLVTGGVFMMLGARLGFVLRAHLPRSTLQPLNYLLGAAAGAAMAIVLAQLVGWLYEITDPRTTIWIPALIGGLIGLVGTIAVTRKESVGTGLTTYYLARTTFNGIRAIEPLVMVIVFVVWVGIGPFAGALALALHTTASLAKLYSEQVENISLGPLEAVKATGATRLQTIVYAVVPQIVPPYISFTMYRWDINVRMSTIIGFAGGGGIGFLLQQNINLLNYRAAAVQMAAIAIVVATMDYVSSRLRERYV